MSTNDVICPRWRVAGQCWTNEESVSLLGWYLDLRWDWFHGIVHLCHWRCSDGQIRALDPRTFPNTGFSYPLLCSWLRAYLPTSRKVPKIFVIENDVDTFVFSSASFTNAKFRTQHNKTDMQKPQWLCRLAVGNELVRRKEFTAVSHASNSAVV